MTPPLHANPGAFGMLPEAPDYAASRFAILPLPYDGTTTWQNGAARGPQAILDASPALEYYDIETGTEPYREGLITMAPVEPAGTPEATIERIRAAAAALLRDGKTVVGLGGEHSVTIGLVQAHAAHFPGLSVLQFDAHTDTRDSYLGSRCNHACAMARVAELCDYVQVGIRSMDVAETARLRPGRTFYAHDHDEAAILAAIERELRDPLYVTIDLDVLDPSEMPATGTPEPGGLRYRQLTRLLAEVCRRRRVVGFDVVELMPIEGFRAPDFLAARLVYQLLAFLTAGGR
ncbi:MAG TPA: agmatinase [Candidatus Krumholzibacteria bacterium]|nr:agmatinase [Candidatus Krumholzibacteria bacterium]HPD70184.1 agmatinase [Candidatus Krumholzibacteria bacterium]HRY40116.1 agmatinase [Candidatus Krumholzibacteria bacterium]